MADHVPTSCARPTVAGVSSYTVLGFIGFGIANLLGAVLAVVWGLTLTDRLITFLLPPLAFLAVVYLARRIVKHERIVFYETTVAAVASVAIGSVIVGAPVARCLDVTVMGIGTFLVFGRLGCFSVACCHGRPARFGVVYGPAHVKLGLWSRWSGRRLWPVQIVEGAASGVLVFVAIVIGWRAPGVPTVIYVVGYGMCRFALELVRGDSARPEALGLSEAQWTSLATLTACSVCWPDVWTIASTVSIAIACVALIVVRHRRELWSPAHLHDVDTVLRATTNRTETRLGVSISCHGLPDGRRDWVLSSTHPSWSSGSARRIANAMWSHYELVEGRLAGVIHVITDAR